MIVYWSLEKRRFGFKSNPVTKDRSELQRFASSNEIKAKAASIGQRKNIRTVVVLEQPRIDFAERLVEHLFEPDRPEVVLCNGPEKTIVEILTSKLQTAAVIAEGVFSDLYRLVAEASQANASLPFEQRRRICTVKLSDEYSSASKLKTPRR